MYKNLALRESYIVILGLNAESWYLRMYQLAVEVLTSLIKVLV